MLSLLEKIEKAQQGLDAYLNNAVLFKKEINNLFSFMEISYEFECYLEITNNVNQHPYVSINQQIRKAFKTTKVSDNPVYHGHSVEHKISHPDYWFIEPDPTLSLYLPTVDHTPVEIISPHIKINNETEFSTIEKFKNQIFNANNGITNENTGFHVNFFTNNLILDPAKLLIFLDEEYHLDIFERSKNNNTIPWIGYLQDIFSKKYRPEKAIAAIMAIPQLKTNKFQTVNFMDYDFSNGNGRIEIRIMGNDYLNTKYDTMLKSLKTFIFLIAICSDKSLYRQDYLNKVHKKISRYDDNDRVIRAVPITDGEIINKLKELNNQFNTAPIKQKTSITFIDTLIDQLHEFIEDKKIQLTVYTNIMSFIKNINNYINVIDILSTYDKTSTLFKIKKFIPVFGDNYYKLITLLNNFFYEFNINEILKTNKLTIVHYKNFKKFGDLLSSITDENEYDSFKSIFNKEFPSKITTIENYKETLLNIIKISPVIDASKKSFMVSVIKEFFP